MTITNQLRFIGLTILVSLAGIAQTQKLIPFRLPGTGQIISYTNTQGEDADFVNNPPSFTDNGDGTITDNVTKLMWQKVDGGEMTYENAATYCDNLVLGGYSDWRLPTGIELFSINHFDNINPAMNTMYFTKTTADYWWTSELRADNAADVWVVNAGGGIGAHPKTETVSAGGTKQFHVRAVRTPITTTFTVAHFTDNGDGTVTDNFTGLIWQKSASTNTMTWEDALNFCNTFNLAGKADWRLPNVRELQSLNDVSRVNPSFNNTVFQNLTTGDYWSSTSLYKTPTKAWDINLGYGIVTQHDKTLSEHILLVRGGRDNKDLNFSELIIPGSQFEMGDHYGFVDPHHPSDELPLHTVKVDSLIMAKTVTTNLQYLAFLNASLTDSLIKVVNNVVRLKGDTNAICYTNQIASYYSIAYDGHVFSMADYRDNHPMVGVKWYGAALFCNWLSRQNGLQECYNTNTWVCDFAKNGYRLPTEAEWEMAGRGGHYDPYFNYTWGDDGDITKANWPSSGDPYESGSYPLTTPVGFYDGSLRMKTDYNWPGNASSYQTGNGINSYGLCDMAGNVWQFINDWYGQTYYQVSPVDNPKGPDAGFVMPDGKPYRGMRGGNWYNGDIVNGVDDGHSRVSNRNPSYYRGPQDPNHPWYHVGFRVARKVTTLTNGIDDKASGSLRKLHNSPNPFQNSTKVSFELANGEAVSLQVYNVYGELLSTLADGRLDAGIHTYTWDGSHYPAGIYTCILKEGNRIFTNKMILIK